ncbi:hypothetical protein I2494_07670 [Budviciaceae bacterium BWR-B9]|uniref:Colicin D immunity protein domain-containing protein n=1 Tax=Limnobaculum allomyrinae TaxID=2791986 RepID=A0ABS1IPC6_9GAMM|nr:MULTISPECIES: hypothetical protein [Limnobaculum]MBK5143593.1 hypothetical protein [Limnobaculum allomyrinae]MBV7691481.1 hypothetical protein [Limnobaculum sp. M2-1]
MNEYETFIDAFLDFDETVRSNEGFNEVKFEMVCSLLRNLKEPIQKAQSVPLSLASVFIDLYSAIESSAYRHNDDMKEKILYAADKLADIARDVVSEY